MTEFQNSPERIGPPRNGMALTAMILGIVGLATSPLGVGAVIGLMGAILGVIAVMRPHRKGMAITGIVTGALALVATAVFALLIAILLPALHAARTTARETAAAANLKQIGIGLMEYAASNGDRLPDHLAAMVIHSGISTRMLRDPRLDLPPMPQPTPGTDWRTMTADVDAHCDFFYAWPGARLMRIGRPSSTILVYDNGAAGGKRVLLFADGHVERVTGFTLTRLIDETNLERARAGLPPLPLDLKSAPATAPSTTLEN